MAVAEGVAPHLAWVTVNGTPFPVERGRATQNKTRKSSTFSGEVPLSYPGAYETFATLGPNQSSISVTTRGQTKALVTGEIDDVDVDLIRETSIRFTGRCQSAALHAIKSSEKWVNRKGSEIVQDLAGRVGLSADVDQSLLAAGKQVQIDWAKMTDGISFAAVIHKLAEFDGARWWVSNGKLFYRSLASPDGVYTLTYVPPTAETPMRADMLDLKIRRNIQAGKNIKVTVKSWHPRKKQVFSETSNVEGAGGSQEYVYHVPNLLQDHVRQHAKASANEHARHELRLTAILVGDPTIDIAMGLQLSGTTFFDQSYEMDSIDHDFGMSGHIMSITARSAKQGRQAS